MNIREYYISKLGDTPRLNHDGGAGDGCTRGDILTEMPYESVCGNDCAEAISNAANLKANVVMAFGEGEGAHPDSAVHIDAIHALVLDVCCCYIRG